MTPAFEVNIGDEIKIQYPFVREEYTEWSEDGPSTSKTWCPGTRARAVYPGDAEMMVADGMGKQIIKVVGIYKAGKFPTRIFFTRSWLDPSGKSFGKHKLCIMTKGAFKRRCSGFQHAYRIVNPAFNEAAA